MVYIAIGIIGATVMPHNLYLHSALVQTRKIAPTKEGIKEAKALIAKYEKQSENVKNSREFEAINKEIEMQQLEGKLAEKHIRDANEELADKAKALEVVKKQIATREATLAHKKGELDKIIAETEKEEKELNDKVTEMEADVEERFLLAFNRIRKSYKNGLAVVKVSRNACGGCFGFIPPQTQSEIRTKKKISTCEHCGRIISGVDDSAVVISDEELA